MRRIAAIWILVTPMLAFASGVGAAVEYDEDELDHVFVTADWHLDHENILRYEQRPYESLAKMRSDFARRWNAVVGPRDVVWVLGDIAMRPKTAKPFLKNLRGKKFLVLGNHDVGHPAHRPERSRRGGPVAGIEEWYAAGFDSVVLHATLTLPGARQIQLSHYPYRRDNSCRDSLGRLADRGLHLLCGHVHSAFRLRDRQLNVGVDVQQYAPISLREALRQIQSPP